MLAKILVVQRVQEVYLRNGRREDDNFIQLPDALHELVNARSLNDVDVVVVALDLHGYREIGLVKYLQYVSLSDQGISYCQSVDTLNEECTRVSSKSKTRHFLPFRAGSTGPRRNFC
jgi:hypothetical protein